MAWKTVYPFLTLDKNFVINVNHIVWFELHSDQTITVGLSVPGPRGEAHINIKQPETLAAFFRCNRAAFSIVSMPRSGTIAPSLFYWTPPAPLKKVNTLPASFHTPAR